MRREALCAHIKAQNEPAAWFLLVPLLTQESSQRGCTCRPICPGYTVPTTGYSVSCDSPRGATGLEDLARALPQSPLLMGTLWHLPSHGGRLRATLAPLALGSGWSCPQPCKPQVPRAAQGQLERKGLGLSWHLGAAMGVLPPESPLQGPGPGHPSQ